MIVVAAMAVMLIGATALATSESAFAGGHGHKKSYEKSQATSQVNNCGNKFMPENVFCQNTPPNELADFFHDRKYDAAAEQLIKHSRKVRK